MGAWINLFRLFSVADAELDDEEDEGSKSSPLGKTIAKLNVCPLNIEC